MASYAFIADEGDRNEQKIPINGHDASWVVKSAGRLSVEVMTHELIRAGLMRPKSKWIRIFDDDLGTWGGVITDSEGSAGGTTEIAAVDWSEGLFDARLVPRYAKPLFGQPGSLALATITATERGGRHLWITERTAVDTGLPIQVSLDGGQLLDVLNAIRSASDQEFSVDMDTMAFRWGRVGRDLTGSVQLVAPRHIVSYRAPDSLAPVVTLLKAYRASDDTKSRANEILAVSSEGFRDWGIREGEATIDSATAGSAARRATQAMVNALASKGASLEFDVVNKDRCFQWFREGDTICVLLPRISSQMDVRVMARSRNDRGVLSVSAEIVEWTVI